MTLATSGALAPSPELVSFARRHAKTAEQTAWVGAHKERRGLKRRFVVEPVIVRCVDWDYQPLAEPRVAVTRDVTAEGVGLIMEHAPPHDLLALQFNIDGEDFHVAVQIAWRKAMGPYDLLGGPIVAQLDGFDAGWDA